MWAESVWRKNDLKDQEIEKKRSLLSKKATRARMGICVSEVARWSRSIARVNFSGSSHGHSFFHKFRSRHGFQTQSPAERRFARGERQTRLRPVAALGTGSASVGDVG